MKQTNEKIQTNLMNLIQEGHLNVNVKLLQTPDSKLGKFNGWNNNFATAPLNVDYGQIDGTFLSTYSCVNLNPNPSTKMQI